MRYNLISMSYKIKIGNILKTIREERGYSVDDVAYMTCISRSSVYKVEQGTAADLDLYVEYAKAVKYPLTTITELGIPLVPKRSLNKEMIKVVRVTRFIRDLIEKDFFKEPKTIGDIYAHLLSSKLIDSSFDRGQLSKSLYHLVQDKLIEKKKDKGSNNNLYFQP